MIVPRKQPTLSSADTSHTDKTILKESFQQEDTTNNGDLNDRLKPIRENFKRINSISTWTSVDKKELDESTEGGDVNFYYSNNILEKITAQHFGETFQRVTEYYLRDGQLSLVLEKLYKYNRPVYYDSTSMKENGDNEVFDFSKSEIVETRSYFENGTLIWQVNSKDYGSPLTNGYVSTEQKRIVTEFDKLRSMGKNIFTLFIQL